MSVTLTTLEGVEYKRDQGENGDMYEPEDHEPRDHHEPGDRELGDPDDVEEENQSYDDEERPDYAARRNMNGYIPDFNTMMRYVDDKQIYNWVREWKQKLYEGETDEQIRDWFELLKRVYGPQLKGRRRCPYELLVFTNVPSQLPQYGQYDCLTSDCSKPK